MCQAQRTVGYFLFSSALSTVPGTRYLLLNQGVDYVPVKVRTRSNAVVEDGGVNNIQHQHCWILFACIDRAIVRNVYSGMKTFVCSSV